MDFQKLDDLVQADFTGFKTTTDLGSAQWPRRKFGFQRSELRRIERVVSDHRSELLERWYAEYGRISG